MKKKTKDRLIWIGLGVIVHIGAIIYLFTWGGF